MSYRWKEGRTWEETEGKIEVDEGAWLLGDPPK
jgi:hypothetical protein